MPESKRQFRAAAAACSGRGKSGMSKKVGCEMTHSGANYKSLPERKGGGKKRK